MTAKRDYYKILGIGRDATGDEIKAKYRKLAIRYHPDKNPNNKEAEEMFKEASEAYEVLRDQKRRQIYDMYGHQGLEGTGFSGFRGFDDIFSSFGDIFEDFFGFGARRGPRSRVQKGADIRYNLTLSFMEAAFGTETEIDIKKMVVCPACNGSMCEPGTHPETCSHCGGMGQVSRNQGFFTVRTTCPNCRGEGQTIPHLCLNCKGAGRIKVSKKVVTKIPAGVDSGTKLRLTGEGEAGLYGGPPGDLYVFIKAEPHEFFSRDNTDVLCRVEISFIQAALGDEIMVPTLNGKKTLKIPKGTQPNDIFRFRSEGIPFLMDRKRGDQVIQTIIKTPTHLNKKQEKLLREFAKLESSKLFTRIKRVFKDDRVKVVE